MPVKVTSAPVLLPACASAAVSAATSMGASVMRTLIGRSYAEFSRAVRGSAAGHRGEKRDLACVGDFCGGSDMHLVEGRADDLRIVEGMRIFFAAFFQPMDQIADSRDRGRQFDFLFRLSDPFANPGEVKEFHEPFLTRCLAPARK